MALLLNQVPPKVIDAKDEIIDIKQDIPLTNPSTQYIEIDDASDDHDPKEEVKEGDKPIDEIDLELSSLHTKTLYKKAESILEIIKQRIRDRLSHAL